MLRHGLPASLCLLSLFFLGPVSAQESGSTFANPAVRDAAVAAENAEWEARAIRVREGLARLGMARRGLTRDGREWEVVDIRPDGRPLMFITTNANAAISTAANAVRNQSAFGFVDGSSVIVGVWDGGKARETHQEFGGRILPSDTAGTSSHGTHVTGTIAASGVNGSAQGMAPGTTVRSFGWGSDTSEASSNAAASAAQQQNMVTVSNHSYGTATGWEFGSWSGTSGWHWFGSANAIEDNLYGGYNSSARSWDNVCYNAPYYLPFRSAGNDRGDGPPSVGETWFYSSGGWQSKAYDPATDPVEDGDAGGVSGYDCIAHSATAKNIVTVGACTDAVSGGSRSVASANSASFSGFGPMDDGRVKPDIVANGVGLFSTGSGSDTSYYSSSGTSMSSPNAAGSAVLLRDYWQFRLPGASLRASTLKALILHAADDKGNTGPDYAWGWGLMNTERAAQIIDAEASQPLLGRIREEVITGNGTLSFVAVANGNEPLVATICWTDPAATTKSGVDNPRPDLVNDLDLRIRRLADDQVSFPWTLDPANPLSPAVPGDNVVDNVEQVLIPAPTPGATYVIEITHKGTLTNNSQAVSLVVTGGDDGDVVFASAEQLGTGCGGVFIPDPALGAAAPPRLGEDFTVACLGVPPGQTGILAVSTGAVPPVPLPDGCDLWLNLATAFDLAYPTAGLLGDWSVTTPIADEPGLVGIEFRMQAFFPGATTNWGWATTAALECVIGY